MESLVEETKKQDKKDIENKLNQEAKKDFLQFLEKNKDSLGTGMGAFHHDDHSNW